MFGGMIYRGLQARAMREHWHDTIAVQFFVKAMDGQPRLVAKPIEMEEAKDNFAGPGPTLTLSRETGQELMDQLWEVGLRPTEGTGSAGALAATQAHLADMKKIAFDLLQKGEAIPHA